MITPIPEAPIPVNEHKPQPKQQQAEHYKNVSSLLARYETEAADMISNQNAPAQAVGELLQAISLLRAEKQFHRP